MKSERGCRVFVKTASNQMQKLEVFLFLSITCQPIKLGTHFAAAEP
jgi:hypothetical protein